MKTGIIFRNPAAYFERAVIAIGHRDETFGRGDEMMLFSPMNKNVHPGAVFRACKEFEPRTTGWISPWVVMICCGILETVSATGRETPVPETKIESDNRGYLAVFRDREAPV